MLREPIPNADVDRVLAAHGPRLQEGVAALQQQDQCADRDEEEVVHLGDVLQLNLSIFVNGHIFHSYKLQ